MGNIEVGGEYRVARPFVVLGELVFKAGDRVTVEKIDPNPERPANRYVVLSERVNKRFQLSEQDLLPCGPPARTVACPICAEPNDPLVRHCVKCGALLP